MLLNQNGMLVNIIGHSYPLSLFIVFVIEEKDKKNLSV